MDIYKQPEEVAPRSQIFEAFDADGNPVVAQATQGSPIYGLSPEEQQIAVEEASMPPTGEELAQALAADPSFERKMTLDEFQRYDDYMRTVETDWVEGIMTGAGMVVDEIGKGLSAMWADDDKLQRAIPTFAEGFARGTRDMYGLVAQSADPQSPLFKFKALLTGDGTPEERFQQFKEAREFNRRSLSIMQGEQNVTDIDPDLINPEMAQALSYVADPSWLIPYVGQAGKAMGISTKSIGLARLGEQIATVGAYAEHLKRLAAGGALKVVGAPLSLLGKAATNTIEWGADRAAQAFEFGTGMAYQDARRVVRDAGLYGGTLFRIPYMSTISDSYIAGWGAAGVGDAMGMLGDVIQRRQRGVYSYAEMALAQGADVLSPQAKALLRIINQADPFLSYGYAAMDGMVTGAVVGGALGYASARGEGAAQGIGMGGVMGAAGGLMGRAWAGMAREGGIIHQRVQTELKFVKEALKDIDPDKLGSIETLEQLAALHGQDLSWQILGMLKLVPDLKLEVLDSAGFEQLRRQQKEGRLNGENENDPLVGLDLNDPADIKKLRQIYNFEGVVVQKLPSGETTLFINADHYRKNTFGHEMFHGIMRMSPFGDEFVKDLREKFLGRVTPEGIEMPGVVEPSKMRAFMERYIKAVYSNNPDQMNQRLQALDAAIKAYEADGTLIPGQDPSDARPVLDILAEEAGAYYFSHMIAGKDMDWLYRGGDLGGLRQVFDDAKEGILNFIESKFRANGMDFDFARSATINEGFLRGGQDGGKRIRVGALDALMAEIVRRQAGIQEGRELDIGQMNGEQQRRFRERNGLGDVMQPRKGGGMDVRRRTAAEESARSKQMVDALRGMDQSQRTSTTIVEKNGDVTIYGDLSNAELDQLVRVGAMMPTEAARYRMFRDTIANKGKGTNVFGASYVGESYEVGTGRTPPRLRRSRGDKVPVTHREFTPIELRTEIKLTKGGKGKATIVVTGLDIKNADMRLRELWFREDVQKTWSGDYNAFAADFYRYLQNASDPKGVPSAEFFGGGQQGSYKRNVFHEAFGAALREGETPFNEPSPTYKGAEGRGEKFVIHSMSLGSIYDVKMRDRNVPYDHSVAYDRVRRNWSPADMRREVMPDGEKLTHEETGFSFLRGPSGRWRAYDEHRRVVGIANDVEQAAKLGQKAWEAKEAKVAKEIKNFSVADKTEITAKGWAPAFFSAVEKFVKSGAITPNMSPEQVWAKIRKANYAGIRVDELRFLGLEARLLGGDNQHLQNARLMDQKVKELFAYSQRFASEDPAKLARVQEVAANLRRKQMEEQAKGEALRREEQTKDGFAPGKPIGQAGIDALNQHLQDRAFGLRMVDQGDGYASFVMDGPRVDDSYKILTAQSNQRTGVVGHFGDNVIVHIRVDERFDPVTGENALVVHEVQANNAENRQTKSDVEKQIEVAKQGIESAKSKMERDKKQVEIEQKALAEHKPLLDAVADIFPDDWSAMEANNLSEVPTHGEISARSNTANKAINVAGKNAKLLLSVFAGKTLRVPMEFIGDGLSGIAEEALRKANAEINFALKPEASAGISNLMDVIMNEINVVHEKAKQGLFVDYLYTLREQETRSVGTPQYFDARLKKEVIESYGVLASALNINPKVFADSGDISNRFAHHNNILTSDFSDGMSAHLGAERFILEMAMRDYFLRNSSPTGNDQMYRGFGKFYDQFSLTNASGFPNSRMALEAIINPVAQNFQGSTNGRILSRFARMRPTNFPSSDKVIKSTLFDMIHSMLAELEPASAGKGKLADVNEISTKIDKSIIGDSIHKQIRDNYEALSVETLSRMLDAVNENKGVLLRPYEGMPKSKYHGTVARALEIRNEIRKTGKRPKSKSVNDKDLSEVITDDIVIKAITGSVNDTLRGFSRRKRDALLWLDDLKINIARNERIIEGLLNKEKNPLVMQTPQDWVVVGLKMAIREAAQRGLNTIVFTDHTGAPAKCGMEYLSAASLYTQIIPTLGNGFLRQYNTKIEMPVLPKVYRFGGIDDNGRVKVLGDNGGVSWQEQLGMRPLFSGVTRREGGGIDYQVNYSQPAVRQLQQQDVHLAQMRNNPRLRLPEELKRQALDEGFANFAPSEGGEVPPMPRSEAGMRRDAAPRKLNVFPKDREFKRWAGKLPLVSLEGVSIDSRQGTVPERTAYNMLKNGFVVTAFHGTETRAHTSFEDRGYNGTYFVPDEKAASEYARPIVFSERDSEVMSQGRDAAYADERTRKRFNDIPVSQGRPGLDDYTFGKPDMYYLRSQNPLVAIDIRTGVRENPRIKSVIDALVRDKLDNENPTRAEYREAFEEVVSRIEAGNMYGDSGEYSIQDKFVGFAFREGFDAAVFFDPSINSTAPSIVMNNAGAMKSNVKAASNIGAFSEDARFDYAPSEMPKGSKDISELGNEPFVTKKNKFDKVTGMYFRERETGRWYVVSYASNGAGYVSFEPADLRNKYIETQDDAIREQIDAEIQGQKIAIRSDSQGRGYLGIEDKIKERFDSYSKKEPSAKPEDDVKPDGPDLDLTAIRTNGDAIKDALTSLDGLGFTKDETFRLFGKRTAKGKTLGLIDEINAEIDKAKAGEEPDVAKIEEKLSELEEMRDEMQEKQENTPEGLQETEAYQNREENIDAINEAIDEVRGLMEPPKGGEGEIRNMSVAENTGALPDNPYKGSADALSTMELWAVAAKAGRLGPVAKMNHKLVTPEVLKTVEWLLTNDNSGITQNRPKSFATIADALKWVRETSLRQYKGPNRKWAPASLTKSFKDAYLASSAILGEPTKKPRNSNVEPKAKDGASFDEWFEWARKKRVNGKSMATARNALKFIAEMPSEGYYKAVAQMLLAMGPVGFLDMQLFKTSRGFMQPSGLGGVGKLAISVRGGGKSGTDVSLKGRTDNITRSTVGTVLEEMMHAAQLTNANYGPMKILKGLGSRGVSWKMGALKLIAQTEADIKGKTYNQLDAGTKELLMAARLAKLILEGTKGIEAIAEGSGKTYDLHEALFGNVVSTGGVWRNESDPSKGGGAGKKLRFRFQTGEQRGTNFATQITGYHFGNIAEFLVGLFSDPDLARFYFDKPPVDLSSLTPKGDPLRTSWRNLASQMIAVAMDFFNGLFGSKKQNYGSQLIEETVLMLQRQAEAFKNMDPVRDIDARIGTNELGFTREPAANEPTPTNRQRGRQPTPGGETIPMGMNQGETGLAVIDGQGARRDNELGPATPVVEGEARPIPKPGRGPIPRIGARQDLPANQYGYPRPSQPPPSITVTWTTGDAMAGQSILTSSAGYMVVLVKNKWRVYNPEREIIAVFNDVEKAKELADRRAKQRK